MMLEIQILRVSPSKKTINTCIGRHKEQGIQLSKVWKIGKYYPTC
jgi:hypothetical protein